MKNEFIIINDDFMRDLISDILAGPIQRTEPSQSKTSQDAFETRHDTRKTGRVVVDYNGAKVPWAPKAWVHTPEGTLRGADIVWDTYPILDVQQRAPESDSQYASQIDRYS